MQIRTIGDAAYVRILGNFYIILISKINNMMMTYMILLININMT